jgi:hypothetical protein
LLGGATQSFDTFTCQWFSRGLFRRPHNGRFGRGAQLKLRLGEPGETACSAAHGATG